MLYLAKSTQFFSDVTQRQLMVVACFCLLFLAFVLLLYSLDRQREWQLRSEQAEYRLSLASEMMTRELTRVKSDALFLSQMDISKRFAAGQTDLRAQLESEYVKFVRQMHSYDQVRLLNLRGEEVIRVDSSLAGVSVTPPAEFQDKRDRYYFQQSVGLGKNEVFVSDFDLNQEHGEIERPLNPVIRFVTPVVDGADVPQRRW